jgi:hypothetical protein
MNTTLSLTKNAIQETIIEGGLQITSKGQIKNPSTFIDVLKPYVNEQGYKLKRLNYNKKGLMYSAKLFKA